MSGLWPCVLIVTDEPIWDGTHIERWMRCNACGHANTILMKPEGALELDEAPDRPIDWTDKVAVQALVKSAARFIWKKG